MYVDTLITLQENLATYAINGKKVSGHVTINSPGIIKCYIQNLKGLESGHEYVCYAFSKAHNKGVKIGTLGIQKESRWKVNEKNVAGSGLGLADLDAIAIVVENGMRGADTVLMGFKNNRYMIIPLIDDIVKAEPKPKMQEKKQVEPKVNKSVSSKNIIQPDTVVEGENPISKMNYITAPSNIWTPGYSSKQTTTEPKDQGIIMSLQSGNADSNNMASQDEDKEPKDQGIIMSLQSGNADSNNMANQDEDKEPKDQGIIMSLQNGNAQEGNMQNNEGGGNLTQTHQNIMSNKVLKVPEYEFNAIVATESLEDNTSILTKTAENLPEVEKAPAVSMSVKSGEAYATSISQNASVVRDEKNIGEMEKMAEQLARELEAISARLKSEQIDTEKLLEVEEQIESIVRKARLYSMPNRSMEQTLENRYTAQQSRNIDENIEYDLANNEEKAIFDTSPKNAITYIQSCMSDGAGKQVFNKVHIIDKQYDISEEMDYLSEMERKIQEIEQRRKNEYRD